MIALTLFAVLILASAVLAMSLRNLIHSALLLTFTWAGVAGFYLWAGAEFVAFAQLLIYVGAVSMVVLFAVLLTQRPELLRPDIPASRRRVIAAIFGGAAVAAVLVAAVVSTPFDSVDSDLAAPQISVHELGHQLMGPHVASLLVIGLILTVALIGATLLAATEPKDRAVANANAIVNDGGGSPDDAATNPALHKEPLA